MKSAVGDEWEEVRAWKDGTLETVRLAGEEDFVALKYDRSSSPHLLIGDGEYGDAVS